jgi:hypothetical protein
MSQAKVQEYLAEAYEIGRKGLRGKLFWCYLYKYCVNNKYLLNGY